MTIEQLAEIIHESNRNYCAVHGDLSQKPWTEAPDWQKDATYKQIQAHFDNPNLPASWSHDSWMKEKIDVGWVYGPVKDGNAKPPTHPDLVPYEQLSPIAQGKDYLFAGIVRALAQFVEK